MFDSRLGPEKPCMLTNRENAHKVLSRPRKACKGTIYPTHASRVCMTYSWHHLLHCLWHTISNFSGSNDQMTKHRMTLYVMFCPIESDKTPQMYALFP